VKTARRNPQFKKSPLSVLLAAALLPGAVCALELSQSPPGTQQSYVAPNVILSLDDSGSMSGTSVRTLRNALTSVFSDQDLLPDGKIRLAWQTMWSCNGVGNRLTPDSGASNAMRVLDATHRQTFLNDVRRLGACGMTPTHR